MGTLTPEPTDPDPNFSLIPSLTRLHDVQGTIIYIFRNFVNQLLNGTDCNQPWWDYLHHGT